MDRLARPTRHQWTYPLLGAALALGAPVGLLVLHLVQALQDGVAVGTWWVGEDLGSYLAEYLYAATSSVVAFAVLGAWLGRREDRLQAGATTDAFTGLWNRGYLSKRLDEELHRAARYRTPLSLVLVDVDGLKQLNDQGGHAAGDEAIRRVAQALKQTTRATDIAARYGGDEFAVVAPSTSGAEAAALGERIRVAVERAEGNGRGKVTVSIGVADLTEAPAMNVAALTRAADQALYAAKGSGRNCVARYTPERPEVMRRLIRPEPAASARLRVCTRHVYGADGVASGSMRVACPDQGRSVLVDECARCPRWKGVYLSEGEKASYVDCQPKSGPLPERKEAGARLANAMSPTVICVQPELGLQAVLEIFLRHNISGAPVVSSSGKPLGVITKTDLLRAKDLAVDVDDSTRLPTTVADVMTPIVHTLEEGAALSQAAGVMSTEGIHRVMVTTSDGELVGVLSSLDVLRWLAEHEGLGRAGSEDDADERPSSH